MIWRQLSLENCVFFSSTAAATAAALSIPWGPMADTAKGVINVASLARYKPARAPHHARRVRPHSCVLSACCAAHSPLQPARQPAPSWPLVAVGQPRTLLCFTVQNIDTVDFKYCCFLKRNIL